MQTTTKVLDVLELFLILNKDSLSFREILESSGMKRSTAHRILRTLINRNFLKQQRKRGHYSPGLLLFQLMNRTSIERKRSGYGAMLYLVELSRLMNVSVYTQIWYGSEVLSSKAMESSTKIPKDWIMMPLHVTCAGKIALANLSDEDFKKYFRKRHLTMSTPKTITDINKMKEELAAVRREGIAFEMEEFLLNTNGIATGIKNSYGEIIGAVFLMGDSKNFTREVLLKLVPSLKLGAESISYELGFRV